MAERSGILFCLVGPAGSGKSTFAERLLQEQAEKFKLSVSVTTRPPRPAEKEGVSYYFVSEAEFDAKIQRGEFFEWEVVHGYRYGTLKSTVEDAISIGFDLILDIDIKGALNFKQNYPGNTVVIFLAPPSFDVLKSRLTARGSVSEDELARRFATAENEYKTLLQVAPAPDKIDYFVVNDQLGDTYKTILSIVASERFRIQRIAMKRLKEVCKIN